MTGAAEFCPRCEEAPGWCVCALADIPGDELANAVGTFGAYDPGPVPAVSENGAVAGMPRRQIAVTSQARSSRARSAGYGPTEYRPAR
jgi:hypothetical protein